jgi:hypothetical protein
LSFSFGFSFGHDHRSLDGDQLTGAIWPAAARPETPVEDEEGRSFFDSRGRRAAAGKKGRTPHCGMKIEVFLTGLRQDQPEFEACVRCGWKRKKPNEGEDKATCYRDGKAVGTLRCHQDWRCSRPSRLKANPRDAAGNGGIHQALTARR